MKWRFRLIVLGLLGLGGYTSYDLYRGGLFEIPDMPMGAYQVSFNNGLRGVVEGVQVSDPIDSGSPKMFRRLASANPDRKYLGIPLDVAPWFQKAWSTCTPPTDDERTYIETNMPEDMKSDLQGARFDAVCYIEIDGEERILRGLLYSVPKV